MGDRNELLGAVLARLERVAASQDLAGVLEPAALTQAEELAATLPGGHSDPEAMLLGWLHWYRYQALPEGQNQRALDAAVAMFTPCFLNGVGDLPEQARPVLADQVAPTAFAMLEQAMGSSDLPLLSATVHLYQRLPEATPRDDLDRAGRLSNLASALVARFERTGVQADLDQAILHLGRAVEATRHDHPTTLGT